MNLFPPSTLLIGPAGTGKTTSLITLLEQGLKVRLLATEPSSPGRVIMEAKKRAISIEQFEWAYVSPSMPSWGSLKKSAEIINTLSLNDISKLRGGIAKPDGTQWLQLLKTIENFPSQRGPLGDATEWTADTAFAIDGLTGISAMSRVLTVGLKPNPAPDEWGTMQGNILNLIWKLCADCKCFFILIAHVEREMNEITGTSNLTVSTLGAKLAPKLPPLFTNVVYAKRLEDQFFWSTADSNVDTKSGDLPLSKNLLPSFRPIVESYRKSAPAAAPISSSPSQSAA